MQALDQLLGHIPLGLRTPTVIDPPIRKSARQLRAQSILVRVASPHGKRIADHDRSRHLVSATAWRISKTEFVRREDFPIVLAEAGTISKIREIPVGTVTVIAKIRRKRAFCSCIEGRGLPCVIGDTIIGNRSQRQVHDESYKEERGNQTSKSHPLLCLPAIVLRGSFHVPQNWKYRNWEALPP